MLHTDGRVYENMKLVTLENTEPSERGLAVASALSKQSIHISRYTFLTGDCAVDNSAAYAAVHLAQAYQAFLRLCI